MPGIPLSVNLKNPWKYNPFNKFQRSSLWNEKDKIQFDFCNFIVPWPWFLPFVLSAGHTSALSPSSLSRGELFPSPSPGSTSCSFPSLSAVGMPILINLLLDFHVLFCRTSPQEYTTDDGYSLVPFLRLYFDHLQPAYHPNPHHC